MAGFLRKAQQSARETYERERKRALADLKIGRERCLYAYISTWNGVGRSLGLGRPVRLAYRGVVLGRVRVVRADVLAALHRHRRALHYYYYHYFLVYSSSSVCRIRLGIRYICTHRRVYYKRVRRGGGGGDTTLQAQQRRRGKDARCTHTQSHTRACSRRRGAQAAYVSREALCKLVLLFADECGSMTASRGSSRRFDAGAPPRFSPILHLIL